MINTEHLKNVLTAKGYQHDTLLDLWIAPDGRWWHMCNDGVLLRIQEHALNEHDPTPRPPESCNYKADQHSPTNPEGGQSWL